MKTVLTILMLVPIFPKLSETFILNQITGLISRGHRVFIQAKIPGDITKMHSTVAKYDLINKTYYNTWPDMNSIDIVIAQTGMRGADFVAIKDVLGFKGKLVTFFRGVDVSRALCSHPKRYTNLFKKGDLFLSVCDFFRKRLVVHGCDLQKIVVHHSAIDCNLFSYKTKKLVSDESIRIITVARFVEKKGIEYALQAFAQVVKKYPNVEYHLVGDGPLEDKYKKIIQQLDIEESVIFHGMCTQQQVYDLLDHSHFFVLPSVTGVAGDQEGIPNVLKEAMACGLPVISTYHSGIPELVQHGVSGLLTKEKDSQALAEYMLYLVEHPECWPVMGAAGRQRVVEEFDKERVNDVLEQILYKLCC